MNKLFIPESINRKAKSQAISNADLLNDNSKPIEREIKEQHEFRKASFISLTMIVAIALICWSAFL